ncbi:hypothetical protein BGX38DRAFT_718768 [Terfezia claveryi]|nr:hypothetical protein BGX38DRAFT_718768 [Terfezia claveryi]
MATGPSGPPLKLSPRTPPTAHTLPLSWRTTRPTQSLSQKPTDTPIYPNVTVTTHASPAPPTGYPTENPTVVANVTYPPVAPPSEGGAVANKATIVGGALAALVGVAAYLL